MTEAKTGAWVKDYLGKKKARFKFLEHEAVTKPVDSARVRNVQLKQIAKALVYMADGKAALAILSGDREVDENKLRLALDAERIRFAGSAEVKAHTGCEVGLVPPVIEKIPKIIDKKLLENEFVSFNAGIATAGIIIGVKELLKVLDNCRQADISFGKTIIGLEAHVQLNTESKMFCSCPTEGAEPNSACCEICLGMPGSKPMLNSKAVDYALKLALALNCKINNEFFFSRKTYFYPDMAKNFQISQYEIPLAVDGYINLRNGKRIRIRRIHMEEDPAALVHAEGLGASEATLVDYNRSGIPLVEVVTEPDMASPEEARAFLDELITILEYLEIFVSGKNAMKADSNISIEGSERVEVKNITSFKGVEKALAFEVLRQKNMIKRGEKIARETRGFDEATNTTKSLRIKETEEDYGYIFEPDLTKIELGETAIDDARKALPELHEAKALRFAKQYKIDEYTAKVLASDPLLANVFEEITKTTDAKIAAPFLTRELLAILNYDNLNLRDVGLNVQHLVQLLKLLQDGKITEKSAKETAIKMVHEKVAPLQYIEKMGWIKSMGEKEIGELAEGIIAQNKKAVEDYKSGNEKAFHFLLGLVARSAKGKAEPRIIERIIKQKIG